MADLKMSSFLQGSMGGLLCPACLTVQVFCARAGLCLHEGLGRAPYVRNHVLSSECTSLLQTLATRRKEHMPCELQTSQVITRPKFAGTWDNAY